MLNRLRFLRRWGLLLCAVPAFVACGGTKSYSFDADGISITFFPSDGTVRQKASGDDKSTACIGKDTAGAVNVIITFGEDTYSVWCDRAGSIVEHGVPKLFEFTVE